MDNELKDNELKAKKLIIEHLTFFYSIERLKRFNFVQELFLNYLNYLNKEYKELVNDSIIRSMVIDRGKLIK